MATGSDVREILQLEDQPVSLSRREVLFGADKPKRKSNAKPLIKKPEGLSREVWGLLYSDSRDPPPIVPTDNAAAGYKQVFSDGVNAFEDGAVNLNLKLMFNSFDF